MSGRLTTGSWLYADHPQELYQLPDEHLDVMLVVKKITLAVCTVDYNVLQVWVVHAAGCTVAPYGLMQTQSSRPQLHPN